MGMGRVLYESFPKAREIFEKANALLEMDLARLCFEGPQETLTRTQYSQPAIFVTSIASLFFLSERMRDRYQPKAACGLSLGEYTALVAAGVLSFEPALAAVRERGRLMEEASNATPGTLAAIFGLSLDKVKALCEKSGTEVANLNCPGQIVVSGRLSDIDRITELAKEAGARRAIRLDVSGPFHSRFMRGAGEKLAKTLTTLPFKKPKIPFISNVTAQKEEDPDKIRENLVRQVSEPVLWEESIRFLLRKGIRQFAEIGPGKVLNGLIRKIDPGTEVFHLESPQEIEA